MLIICIDILNMTHLIILKSKCNVQNRYDILCWSLGSLISQARMLFIAKNNKIIHFQTFIIYNKLYKYLHF